MTKKTGSKKTAAKPTVETFGDIKKASKARIELLPLAQLLSMAHKKNPKEHDLEALAGSFGRFGFIQPPLLDEASSVLVAGHGRCEALELLEKKGSPPPAGIEVAPNGEWLVPTVRGVSFANDRERDAYVIADNQHVMNGGWRFEMLTSLLGEIGADGGNYEGLGFEQVELDNLLGNYVDTSEPSGFDPEANGTSNEPSGGGKGDKPRTEITAKIECPNCGHMIQR
jgi:hypothetical protein